MTQHPPHPRATLPSPAQASQTRMSCMVPAVPAASPQTSAPFWQLLVYGHNCYCIPQRWSPTLPKPSIAMALTNHCCAPSHTESYPAGSFPPHGHNHLPSHRYSHLRQTLPHQHPVCFPLPLLFTFIIHRAKVAASLPGSKAIFTVLFSNLWQD